ncbi:phospholipase/carboxylesterase [Paenibacillus sp. CCS19]|uniref:alpha/beta hydrolase n=1 Tax=Paenibacillus sp. CCS19 TaxID=3158387 RepID=UPI0025673443|nr:alpha/beta hydrolase [Paenibacillus cellulosilyticus]GMK42299.1 phospholipase/carboxylesterase [Paenibacillus cellulosilyticus]
MKHIFKQGSDAQAPVLVVFHGTGGTENDLLGLAALISPTSSVLSIRGNVLENGMPRFFRRIAEGVFDEEDLVFRTSELNDFLEQAAAEYKLDRNNFVAVGYSNGANIAGSLLFHYRGSLRGAILHHPMVPRRGIKLPDLTGVPIFIGAGENDPICSPVETEELEQLFDEAGALVDVHWERAGHRLTQTEAEAAAQWFKINFAK